MITSILAPYDGSPPCNAALSIAASMATITKARLTGLYVKDESRLMPLIPQSGPSDVTGLQPVVYGYHPPESLDEVQVTMEHEAMLLKQLFQRCCRVAGIAGNFLTPSGLPKEELLRRSKAADFIVLGKNWQSNSRATSDGIDALGVPFALLRHSTAPLLYVPGDIIGHNSIVVAYDGSEAAQRVLRFAVEFALLVDISSVHILTIARPSKFSEQLHASIEAYLKPFPFQTILSVREGDTADVIHEYAEEIDASIIAVGTTNRSRIGELLFGSTTTSIFRHAPAAVLSMQ